jgi:hypothetical protein
MRAVIKRILFAFFRFSSSMLKYYHEIIIK